MWRAACVHVLNDNNARFKLNSLGKIFNLKNSRKNHTDPALLPYSRASELLQTFFAPNAPKRIDTGEKSALTFEEKYFFFQSFLPKVVQNLISFQISWIRFSPTAVPLFQLVRFISSQPSFVPRTPPFRIWPSWSRTLYSRPSLEKKTTLFTPTKITVRRAARVEEGFSPGSRTPIVSPWTASGAARSGFRERRSYIYRTCSLCVLKEV